MPFGVGKRMQKVWVNWLGVDQAMKVYHFGQRGRHGYDVFARMAVLRFSRRDQLKGRIWQCRAFLMVCTQFPTLAELAYYWSEG
jgi:hypothetical protein